MTEFVERHRIGVLATGLALIALGGTSLVASANYGRAERERATAAARFEDARGSARYVAMDLLGELAKRPGTLELRTRAAAVAQRYLDRLATVRDATPAARLDAAEGLLRLAAAQGRPGDPNLGQTAAARANLDRAAALAAAAPLRRVRQRPLPDGGRYRPSASNNPANCSISVPPSCSASMIVTARA